MPDLLLETVQKKIADGNLAGALQDLNRAIHADPKLHLAVLHRGMVHIRMHNFKQALDDLNYAVDSGFGTAEALCQRGLAKIQLQDYQGAIVDCHQAAQLDPENYQNYLHEGLAHFNLGAYEASIPCFTSALNYVPAHQASRRLRGMAYCLCGLYDDAFVDFEQTLHAHPEDDQSWFWLGFIHQQQQRNEAALDAYSKSLSLNGYNKSAYVSRGRVYLAQGNKEKALLDFLTAKDLDPDWDILPTLIREARQTEGRGGVFGAWRALQNKYPE